MKRMTVCGNNRGFSIRIPIRVSEILNLKAGDYLYCELSEDKTCIRYYVDGARSGVYNNKSVPVGTATSPTTRFLNWIVKTAKSK